MGSLVSLVMTDIVDSTRRWNAAEGAMAADLELHDRLIREVVEGAGGSVFKHTGDGLIAVFDDPVAAAGAAAGIQQAIGGAQWQHPDGLRVRAAVHTGVVYPRDGDLFGTAVNKVARLLGACPPGAVLVSGATTALLTDRAPEGLMLQPVGQVSLAGFATPDDVHSLVGAGLAEVMAVATSQPAGHGTGIPSIDEELVGRTDELAAVWEALVRTRLVTLVGVGGMGKTCLALEVAAGAVAAYDGAVWWIDLANATTADAVIPVAMAAVDARETPGRTALQALCDRLAGVSGLVVVDNCEHVLRAARELVAALRSSAGDVRVVCTSREALGLRGEQILAIGSLPSDDGVTLFRQRALAVRADLDVNANSAVIERICTRLDGIPLAIELAAARCRSMTPAEVDRRLDDRFRLLRSGRDGAERHRTLQAAVAWSYSLLDHDERTVFDQMAVFAGGTLIDGLAAVTTIDDLDALDIVDRLVARSMVVATTTPLGTRYHQLETLRQYAEDRLIDAGTIGEKRNRHLEWARKLGSELSAARGIEHEIAALARFTAEVDNLRVAVGHAVGSDHHAIAHEIVALLAAPAMHNRVYEMFEWVQPIELDGVWTTAAAVCEATRLTCLTARDLEPFLLTSADDLPGWYHAAPVVAASALGFAHVQSGGSCQIALDLLERCGPRSESELLRRDARRLMLTHIRALSEPLTVEQVDEVAALTRSVVERARALQSVTRRTSTLTEASFGLAIHQPEVAKAIADEALELARQLGAPGLIDNALIACELPVPATSSEGSAAALTAARNAIAKALDDQVVLLATVRADRAAPVVARYEMDSALRLHTVRRRVTGLDTRMLYALRGVEMPDDLAELERATAHLSLEDAINEFLAALDRVTAAAAAAEAEAAVGGDG